MKNQNDSPFLYPRHSCFNSLKHLIYSDTSIQRQSRNTGIPNIPAIICQILIAIFAIVRGFSIRSVAKWNATTIDIDNVGFSVRRFWKSDNPAGATTLILLCFHRDKKLKVITHIHKSLVKRKNKTGKLIPVKPRINIIPCFFWYKVSRFVHNKNWIYDFTLRIIICLSFLKF